MHPKQALCFTLDYTVCCQISFDTSGTAVTFSPSALFNPATAAQQVCVQHSLNQHVYF